MNLDRKLVRTSNELFVTLTSSQPTLKEFTSLNLVPPMLPFLFPLLPSLLSALFLGVHRLPQEKLL